MMPYDLFMLSRVHWSLARSERLKIVDNHLQTCIKSLENLEENEKEVKTSTGGSAL